MTVLSKNDIDYIGRTYTFCRVLHEGRDDCFYSQMRLVPAVALGSSIFFFTMYAAQLFFESKKIKKSDIKPILISFIRSVTFAITYQNLFFLAACYGGRIMRPFYAVGYLSSFASGLSCFIDDPKRRLLVSTTLTALAIEAILRRTYFRGLVKRSRALETIVFMLLNARVMYSTAQKSRNREKQREIWFFKPKCSQTAYYSYKFILNETWKFLSIGFTISLMKALAKKRKNSFWGEILVWTNLKIPATVGSYVFLYYITMRFLNTYKNKETNFGNYFPVVSGFIAGSSYYINPNLTVLSTLILQVLKDLGRKGADTIGLPKWCPYWDIAFIASNAVLLNTRVFLEDACPKAFDEMINHCTRNRVEDLMRKLHELKK